MLDFFVCCGVFYSLTFLLLKDRLPVARSLMSDQVYYGRETSVTIDFTSNNSSQRNGFSLQYQAGGQPYSL